MSEDVATRRGAVTRLDDGRQRLEFRREWPDPIDDVWAALTEPARRAGWRGASAAPRGRGAPAPCPFPPGVGARGGAPMTILECDPPRRLVVEWVQQDSDAWRVDLDLTTEGDRTVLRFVQVFGADADVTDFAMGWHWYLAKLEAELGVGPAPGHWDAFYAQVGPAYGRT